MLAMWHPSLALALSSDVQPTKLRPDLAPNQSDYNPTDPDLREAAGLVQRALNAENVKEEERLWTLIIDKYGKFEANWVPDVVGRAWGNRGNARSRQGKLQEALADYNEAIRICPWSGDPVLNRGVVLEALGRFPEAITDYQAVLEKQPQDPAAWNNLGNATAGLGNWKEAVEYYGKAASLAPEFAFAGANKAVALYQLGQVNESMREMRALLRRYPEFADVRAALTAALWGLDKVGDAETNWQRISDPRYRDLDWLRKRRRWPPRLMQNWQAFLEIKAGS
eukprot:jgi/Astpho2/334/Aster-02215